MKLSIIIPIYNAETTLRRCIDSILEQDFRDYQIILVDDGSTDNSPAICDEYVKADHRALVLHKPHCGLSEARNTGIKKAKGEYITFVDADDAIARDTLSELMELLGVHQDYDMLEYSVYVKYGHPRKQRLMRLPTKEYHDMRQYWLEGKAYDHTFAWNKIYRREVFDEVKYPPKKKFEDVYTLPRILKNCNTVATTDLGLYYYYYNPNGITENANGRALSDLLYAHCKMLYRCNDADYYARVLNIQLDAYELTGKRPILPQLRKMRFVKTTPTLKLKLLKLIGIKRLCILNKLLHKIYRNK